MSRAVKAAAVALLAAAWLTCAIALWRSSIVPGNLRLPPLEVRSLFTPAELARAARFERFLRIEFIVSQLVLIVALAFWAWRGPGYMRESAAGRIGTGMLLGMLGLAVGWLSQLPFSVAEVWWERRYGLLRTSYLDALFGDWFGLGAEFVGISLTLLIVMGLAGWFPRNWWLAAAPVFIGMAALFVFAFPYLSNTHELRNPRVAADARVLAREEGLGKVRVEVQDVSADTSAPNAEAVGLGPSRRVILWNTLLDFPRDEIRVVLAHELGHLKRDHLLKALAWYTLFAFPGAYLIALLTRRRGGMRAPEAVPLSLLVVTVLGLLALPLQAAVSRHTEAEADWVALNTTKNPAAAQRLFRRFTRVALEQPNPPGWWAFLTADHPTVEDRIRMARAWQLLHPR